MKYFAIFCLLFLITSAYAQVHDSIVLKDAALHYYAYGKGKPVIILSGGPGVASSQEDDLAKELGKKYQAILFDQRGTGKSWTRPLDNITINLDRAIEDIELLRQHLKQEQIAISGHSWGAMLASAYANKYPQRIRTLVLIGGGELDMKFSPVIDASLDVRTQLSDSTLYKFWSDPQKRKAEPDKFEAFKKEMAWKKFTYDPENLIKVLEQANRGKYSGEMGSLMWKSLKEQNFDITQTLPMRYKNPALVIFGWQDPVGATTVSMYEKAYPQAQVYGINKCGHMPTVEQPEEFYKIVFAFLDKNL